MLTIYCGDDTVSSRDALLKDRAARVGGGMRLVTCDPSDIDTIIKNGGSLARDLFSGEPIYETQGLISALRKHYVRKTKEKLRELAASADITILDWEGKSAYDLGIDKDKFAFVREYRMPESSFSLLPSFVPHHASDFLKRLNILTQYQPIEVTFAMLVRHVRLMLMLHAGHKVKDSPYLIRLAQSSLHSWDHLALTQTYERLLSVDVNVKTGRNTPLTLREQLEVVASMTL